jgi:hypothetical protein
MEGNKEMTELTALQEKKRHGCLTAYLVLAIILNSATALLYLFGAGAIKRCSPNIPDWAFPVLFVIGLFNLACAIALLRWKKWGFWGLVASAAVTLGVNLTIGLGISSAVVGILGVLFLYGVLHIGKDNKGWPQLD